MKLHKGRYKRGMGLIECLVYVGCSALFISLAGKLLFEIQSSVQRQAVAAERWVELAVALDAVCRCFKEAPREKIFWKVMGNDQAIFRTQAGDRGIMMEKGRLVNVRGMYNSLNSYWMNRSHSVLLENARLAIGYESCAGKIVCLSINLTALCGGNDLSLDTFVAVG